MVRLSNIFGIARPWIDEMKLNYISGLMEYFFLLCWIKALLLCCILLASLLFYESSLDFPHFSGGSEKNGHENGKVTLKLIYANSRLNNCMTLRML